MSKVVNLGSDTFGNPIFQKALSKIWPAFIKKLSVFKIEVNKKNSKKYAQWLYIGILKTKSMLFILIKNNISLKIFFLS